MKKKTIIIIAIIAVVAIIAVALIGTYNNFIEDEEEVKSAQSQISVMLQRRADLIPNFVNTVKGYSDFEKSTLTAITEARAKAGSANTVSEQQAAGEQLDKAISVWINAVTEAYPDLKANTQYQALLDELAGSENRLATARRDYNEEAREFNASIRKFPANIIAGIFGFKPFDYFTETEGAQSVPKVDFN